MPTGLVVMSSSFVSLHTHTEFSLLDGAARISDLVAAAAVDGQPALGITDHGNLYGALEFHDACRTAGITPVLGMEAYFAPGGIADRPARGSGDKAYHHLSVLAVSDTGWRNLVKLSSRAFLEGYHYKPRIDLDMLADHADGLVVLSGCLGGTVCQHLLAGDAAGATDVAGAFVDILGRDNFYVEVMRHNVADQEQVLPGLVDLARRLDVGLVATNDCHYVHAHDAPTHDALLCVQTGAKLADEQRFRFANDQFYLRTAAEMRHLFAELPEACDNTLVIAERATVTLAGGEPALPAFPVPDGHDAASYLRELVTAGAADRYGAPISADAHERIDYELGVIHNMGFDDYFLVVADLVTHAHSAGIRVGPGRGSAAGSVVAYCLGIVQIDPLAHGLLFERFLNPGRRQMPDIDMDFDSRFRDEIIRYAAERYGADHVAQIATFGRIKARAAVRDAARVLDKPYALGDKISKAMPPLIQGRDTPLAACLTPLDGHEEGYALAEELRELAADPEVAEVLTLAQGLEGLVRQDGIHAGAVVIGPAPLTDILPVQRKPDTNGGEAPVVTQFDMDGVERLGLLKMDVLGLRTLDVMDRAVKLLAASGIDLDIDNVRLDDPATYALLSAGDTVGVFQLEGAAMRRLLRRLEPSCFDDVAAVVALYRPGPMAQNWHLEYADRKNGRKPVVYTDPDLETVLGETYGLMIYQESLMQLAQVLAGYSLAEADELRKACGKKNRDLIATHRAKFVAGCEAHGYSSAFAEATFDTIEPFADYAFNKSHATCYGLIAYQTAYLKAHHPAEYLAALISSVAHDMDKAQGYLAEAARLGVVVRVPDINIADVEATVDADGAIVLGLGGVRGVGAGVAETIVVARGVGFASLAEVVERTSAQGVTRRTLEALANAGVFDAFGARKATVEAMGELLARAGRDRAAADAGRVSLFDLAELDAPVDLTEEYEPRERMAIERQMLGVYVTAHPLDGYRDAVATLAEASFTDLDDPDDPDAVHRLVGVVTGPTERPTKAGGLMASFTLAGLDGFADVVVFAKTYAACRSWLHDGTVVVVAVRRSDRSDNELVAVAIDEVNLEALAADQPAGHTPAGVPDSGPVGSDTVPPATEPPATEPPRTAADPEEPPADLLVGDGGERGAKETVEAPVDSGTFAVARTPVDVVEITLPPGWLDQPGNLHRLRATLAGHRGDTPVEVVLADGRRLRLASGFAVQPSAVLAAELAGLDAITVRQLATGRSELIGAQG